MKKPVQKTLYECPICKLHYSSKLWVKRCESWCKKHPSCNLEIASHSIETKQVHKNPQNSEKNELVVPISKNKFLLSLLVLLSFIAIVLSYPLLSQQPFFANFAKILRGNRVETGYIKNGNYADRKIAVFEETNPKNGFTSKIVLGDTIPKLVSLGVIDIAKMQQVYQGRGGIPKDEMQLLTKSSRTSLTITASNANWIVNLLWAIGLSNKMEINKQSPVNGPGVNNFASTGGWTLGKEESGGVYFNKYQIISLTAEQQKRVKIIADNTFRPCCNNSTFFQDCNHGSAGMALIELGVSQGLSDTEIYKTLLAFNAFWFPQNYNEIALYFNVVKKTDWHDVDPKLALSKSYSSVGGWMTNIDTEVAKVPNLLPKPQNSGSCGA